MSKSRSVALVMLATIALATFSVITPVGAQGTKVPGVTAKEIKVGGVVGKTNPTGAPYEAAVVGAQAYFDRINKQGGAFGKKFKVVANYDDQTRDSKNLSSVRSLVEDDGVFAVVPVATQTFAGADYLTQKGTPTFGWNIQSDWSKGPNLFGEKGSYLCFTCPSISPIFIAQQVGAKSAAVLTYGSSPQSVSCGNTQKLAYDKWGPKLAFIDTNLSFGFSANDIAADVQAVKDNNVDFISTCMDVNGEVNFQRALKAAGVNNVKFYAPEGYDQQVLKELGADLNGFTFVIDYVPFELAKGNPELTAFEKAMKAHKVSPSEQALAGWQSAALLVAGIKAAGKNFTQKSVVDAINNITDWTANGTRALVNWKTAHGPAAPGELGCDSYVTVKDQTFTPVYDQPGKPFVCFPINPYPADLKSPTYSAPT